MCADVRIDEECDSNTLLTSIRKRRKSGKEFSCYVQERQLRRWLLVSLCTVMWTAEAALMCSEYVQFLSANMFSVEPFCASKDIDVQSACTN